VHSIDRGFLTLERTRPDARWDTGGIAYLDGPAPRLSALRAHVETRLTELPMLAHKLERSARPPVWLPDKDFSVDHHVHEAVVDGPGNMASALEPVLDAPLPHDAPWGLWLVHGHAPDGYALCYRLRHFCQDGPAVAATFHTLFGAGGPAPRPLPHPRRHGDLVRRTLVAAGLSAKYACAIYAPRPRRPAASFVPTGKRTLVRARVSLDRLRRIGAIHGGSANDTYLAALAGALAAWSEEAGIALPRVAALLPIDGRRHDEEQTWGNRCFAVPVELPVSETFPSRRMAVVRRATAKVKRRRNRQAIRDLVRFMPDRPTEWYMRRLLSPRVTAIMATSVPLAERGALKFGRVTGVTLLPLCLPGHLFGVGMSLFGDWAEVSFVADRALPRAERLPDLWTQAVEELEQGQ
jgi:hypothetical protein